MMSESPAPRAGSTVHVTSLYLARRLKRALTVGFLFFTLVIGAVIYVQYFAPQDEGLASPLRTSHELNEIVARQIYAASHQIEKPNPPAGKKPRVNGLIGLKSAVDFANYRVKVESGDSGQELNLDQIRAMPRSSAATDFKCIEGWTEVMQYAGVKFTDFMDALNVGRRPDGTFYRYVGLETPDGEYYVSIDIESMMSPQTMLVYEMNQAELAPDNGFPLRLMIPNKYGIKSLKRVGRIFFADVRPPDYWHEEGYDWYAGL